MKMKTIMNGQEIDRQDLEDGCDEYGEATDGRDDFTVMTMMNKKFCGQGVNSAVLRS